MSTRDALTFGVCAQPCPTLCDPVTVARQAPLSMGFPRQEYWSELLFPSPALSFLSDAKKLKVLFLDKTGFSEKMMFLLNLEK